MGTQVVVHVFASAQRCGKYYSRSLLAGAAPHAVAQHRDARTTMILDMRLANSFWICALNFLLNAGPWSVSNAMGKLVNHFLDP